MSTQVCLGRKKICTIIWSYTRQQKVKIPAYQLLTKTHAAHSTKTLARKKNPNPFSSMELNDHIEKILWTEQQISERVSELGSQITQDFKSRKIAPVIVGVATGAFLFTADLARKIQLPIAVDFIRVESYASGTVSNGRPTISFDLKLDVRGKHVILVEDIVDTGSTLSCLIDYMKSKGASSISVCTLLDKPARRKIHFELFGEGKYYCGFECPDYFVVGYGLDFDEVYRNLPYVGVLKPELYQ